MKASKIQPITGTVPDKAADIYALISHVSPTPPKPQFIIVCNNKNDSHTTTGILSDMKTLKVTLSLSLEMKQY